MDNTSTYLGFVYIIDNATNNVELAHVLALIENVNAIALLKDNYYKIQQLMSMKINQIKEKK